jgi:hypothetical protein
MKFTQLIFFTAFFFSNLALADTTSADCICQKYFNESPKLNEHTKPDVCTIKSDSSGASLAFNRVDSKNTLKYSITVNSNRVSCHYEQSTTSSIIDFFKNFGYKSVNHTSNFSLPNGLTAKDAINNCAIYVNKNFSDSNPCQITK